MVGILDSIDQRTSLVGQNRLELLLFQLEGEQAFGINVFKVREILRCPYLTHLPSSHPAVKGITNIRGSTISVIDLNQAIGFGAVSAVEDCNLIITEFNESEQGMLVKNVDHIVNLNWDRIHSVPKSAGTDHYLTAVTEVDEKIVQIVDIEKVLAELNPNIAIESSAGLDKEFDDELLKKVKPGQKLLIVEDSTVARKQICNCLGQYGFELIVKTDGKQALDHIQEILEQGDRLQDHYALMISDIEMPEMDGYTLTTNIRNDARANGFSVFLHTSMSGGFNQAMVEKAGADEFVPKCRASDLARRVIEYLDK